MAQQTILYVDDEENIRLVVQACLEADGFRVLTAGSAPEALKIAFSEFPHLVITDVMMPGESGYSLTTKLRKDPSTRGIPVIIMTVLENEREALNAGATAFLTKPFEEEELRKTVHAILKPSDHRVTLDAALECMRNNQVEPAMRGFQQVIQADPKGELGIWARYYAAQVAEYQGDPLKAAEQLRALLADDPTFFRAHNRLGLLSEKAGEPQSAVRHYQRSLGLNGAQADVQQRLDALVQKG